MVRVKQTGLEIMLGDMEQTPVTSWEAQTGQCREISSFWTASLIFRRALKGLSKIKKNDVQAGTVIKKKKT